MSRLLAQKFDSSTSDAHIADFSSTTDLTGVDTGTDMTAAQAAQIEADFAALETKLNAVLAVLEEKGALKTS